MEPVNKKIKVLKPLKHCSDEEKNNYEFVLKAVKERGLCLKDAPKKYRENKNIIKEAIKQNPLALQFAIGRVKNSKELNLLAVSINGNALRYVNSKLTSDPDIVSTAITQNKLSIIYASSKIKDDEEFMLKYIRKDGSFIRYVSDRLYNIKKIVMIALETDANVWPNIYADFKYDNDILLAAIKQNENIINHFPESYKKNTEFMIEAIKINGLVIKYAPEILKSNRSYAYMALINNYRAILYISKKLQDVIMITFTLSHHKDFLNLLGKINNKYIKYLYHHYYDTILNQISLRTFMIGIIKKSKSNNFLNKLNLGHFSCYFYKEIYQYLNIPKGNNLVYLHRAYYNLTTGISNELLTELRENETYNINIKFVKKF